jgi:hypothetical protein
MSTLKVNKIRDNSGSTDAIVLDPSGGAVLAGVTTVSTVKVGSGVTISSDGDVFTTGITTSSSVIVGSGVTITESGIEASGIGITCANINGAQIGGRRNLLINGAMRIAQRGTSSTSSNYRTVDRWAVVQSVQNAVTQAQVDVASGTTPYSLGFRKALKVTNGDQSNGATAGTILYIRQFLEAQDIAQSGWNYTSSSSFITLSFWIKSSVAQSFHGHLRTRDGTDQRYLFQTGALTANTWTKITKTISGNSNLQFDTDTTAKAIDKGLDVTIIPYMGTTYSSSSATFDQWQAEETDNFAGTDMTTTWFTTNDATFEVTGVQLEVGSQATAFEHRTYGDELTLCLRYYQSEYFRIRLNGRSSETISEFTHYFKGIMRTQPTVTTANVYGTLDSVTFGNNNGGACYLDFSNDTNLNFAATVNADAEL